MLMSVKLLLKVFIVRGLLFGSDITPSPFGALMLLVPPWEGSGVDFLLFDTTPSPPQCGAGSSGTPPGRGDVSAADRGLLLTVMVYLVRIQHGYMES
jgi:hypothetical protein